MERQYRDKIDSCIKLVSTMTPFEQKFLNNVSTFSTLSVNQKAKIDQIFTEYVDGKKGTANTIPTYESDRIKIDKTSDGHQILIDGVDFGEPVTKREADMYSRFISRAITLYGSKVEALNKQKPTKKRKTSAFED